MQMNSNDSKIVPTSSTDKNEPVSLTRKQQKLKRKIINSEISEYAKKKQYKLAYKRFIYSLNHGNSIILISQIFFFMNTICYSLLHRSCTRCSYVY